MKATAQQLQALASKDPTYCQVQRNAIWYHRNQMRFLASHGPQYNRLTLMRSHADEIKLIYRELDQACGIWSH
jgi:hypothetical protein